MVKNWHRKADLQVVPVGLGVKMKKQKQKADLSSRKDKNKKQKWSVRGGANVAFLSHGQMEYQ